MSKLLILTYHFPPSAASGSYRLLGFAHHLPKHGWGVGVVAPRTLPWEPVDEALMARVPDSTRRFDAPYDQSLLLKPLRKVAPYWSWIPRGWQCAVAAVREFQPDALLTSGPPHCIHSIGLRLKKRFGIPWIADFRDPWITGASLSIPSCPQTSGEARKERVVVREADMVILNTERGRNVMSERFPEAAEKLASIPNGYDAECFPDRVIARRVESTVTLLHAGTLYAGRDPRPLLEAVRVGLDRGRFGGKTIKLKFLGAVTEGFNPADVAAAHRLQDQVDVMGHKPYAEAVREMVDADILVLLDSPGRRIGVPAKVFEYIGAGRPILAIGDVESEIAGVLRENGGTYRVAPAGDVSAITESLAELISEHEIRGERPQESREIGRFSREGMVERLVRGLERVTFRSGLLQVG